MAHKSEKEARLLSASKAFDAGLARFDLSHWDDILDEHAVLHKDKLTLLEDIHGIGAVKAFYQAYIDRYNYQHTPVLGAVDEHANVAFSLHVDKHVCPKGEQYKQQHADNTCKPSDTIGVFCFRFGRHNEKITQIFFGRQLSHDEAARKLKKMPDYTNLNIGQLESYKGSVQQSNERAVKHDHVAALYNHIWGTGDVSLADTIFAKDVQLNNVVYGGAKEGVESFKSMVSGIFKEYKVHHNTSTVAVTPGDKAFIFWRVTGEYKGDFTQNYGISMLMFDTSDKIKEVLTFMAPFPAQQRELLKAAEE